MELDALALHWARRHDRVSLSCPVELRVFPDGPTLRGRTYDISLAGVGLVSEAPLEVGTIVCITFLWNHWQVKTRECVTGHVVSMESDIDGNRLGIEFETVIGQACQPHLAATIRELYILFGAGA